jgi:hypothetical protein
MKFTHHWSSYVSLTLAVVGWGILAGSTALADHHFPYHFGFAFVHI